MLLRNSVQIEISPGLNGRYAKMINMALDMLSKKLGLKALAALKGVTIKIGPDLTSGGGEARAEEKLVLLNSSKVNMALQQAEDLLVSKGFYNRGERTRLLPAIKNEPWSTLVYELIHEIGHILGEGPTLISKESSPTKYGKTADHEAFAEAFTYWVLGYKQDKGVENTLAKYFGK